MAGMRGVCVLVLLVWGTALASAASPSLNRKNSVGHTDQLSPSTPRRQSSADKLSPPASPLSSPRTPRKFKITHYPEFIKQRRSEQSSVLRQAKDKGEHAFPDAPPPFKACLGRVFEKMVELSWMEEYRALFVEQLRPMMNAGEHDDEMAVQADREYEQCMQHIPQDSAIKCHLTAKTILNLLLPGGAPADASGIEPKLPTPDAKLKELDAYMRSRVKAPTPTLYALHLLDPTSNLFHSLVVAQVTDRVLVMQSNKGTPDLSVAGWLELLQDPESVGLRKKDGTLRFATARQQFGGGRTAPVTMFLSTLLSGLQHQHVAELMPVSNVADATVHVAWYAFQYGGRCEASEQLVDAIQAHHFGCQPGAAEYMFAPLEQLILHSSD